MKAIGAAILTIAIAFTFSGRAEAFGEVRGNGRLVELRPQMAPFTSVSIGSSLHGEVGIGAPSVIVRIDENLAQLLRVEVRDGQLHIGAVDGASITPSAGALVRVIAPSLNAVGSSGAAQVTAQARSGDTLELRASGASRLTLDGQAPRVVVRASGASQVDCRVPANDAEVLASGAAQVSAHAAQSLRFRGSGGSSLTVHGNPSTREVQTSGGAGVSYTN